jgi:transposase
MEPPGALVRDLSGADRTQRDPRPGDDRQHAHQGAPLSRRRKRGAYLQALGHSRGGKTSKLHALSDEHGRPRVLLLTAGNINDISVARALLKAAGPVRGLIADRGYDANHLRRYLSELDAEVVEGITTSRRHPIPYDRAAYKDRNRIERMWCRLKDWRRIATRYDKLARNYLSGAYLAALLTCWPN